MRSTTSIVISLVLIGACKRGEPTGTGGTPTGDTPVPSICGELRIEPSTATLEAGQSVQFVGTGGTGAYRFTVAGQDGGAVDEAGVYVAPPEPVADQVVLRDDGCPGSAIADITTVPALRLEPTSISVPTGTVVEPSIAGGAGAWACGLGQDQSGASLDGCVYTAGQVSGVDTVEVVDTTTGAVHVLTVEVVEGLVVSPVLAAELVIPVGMGFVPTFAGGSGVFDLSVNGTGIVVDPADPGRLLAEEEGLATVMASDRYAPDLGVQFTVTGMAPVVPPATLDGQLDGEAQLLRRDLDGDGRAELLVGLPGASVDGPAGGWVGVYRGGADGGVDSAPLFELADAGAEARLGTGLAVGDLDGDGLDDLAVGAPGADGRGEVRVHAGLGDGRFDPLPVTVHTGAVVGDALGRHVGICDVDGDGLLDLIASGSLDPAGAVPDVGTLSVWTAAGGHVIRRGRLLVGGAYAEVGGSELGSAGFAVGDHDGDGLCDVAVASSVRDRSGGAGPGVVAVYAGSPVELLAEDPVHLYGGDLDIGEPMQFGHALAFGELDGQLGDELVVSARHRSGAVPSAGWVGVFAGGVAGAEPVAIDGALAGVFGSSPGGAFGESVQVVDGALFVGAPQEGSGGRIQRFAGLPVGGGQLVGEGEAGARYGAAVLGGDPVVALEARHSGAGAVDVERIRVGDLSLDVVGLPSRQRWGSALVAVDVTGAGEELLLAGPRAARTSTGARSGRLIRPEARQDVGRGLASQGLGDERGVALAVGDVNSDGLLDLFVGAAADSRPEEPEDLLGCDGASRYRVGSVGVFLGRDTGLAAEPAYGLYGVDAGAGLLALAGGVDADGDGADDLVASFGQDRVVVAPLAGLPEGTEICAAGIEGPRGSDFGSALAPLGDLDGDGCEDLAIGARLARHGLRNEGAVYVLWGHGPVCSSQLAQVTVLRSAVADAEAGAGLGAGEDLTGDGIPDLVVGAPGVARVGRRPGGVWLVDGAWIAQQSRSPVVDGAVPAVPDASLSGSPVLGPVDDGRFGEAVAVHQGKVAVGAWDARTGGGSGGVALYEVVAGVLQDEPYRWIAGEDVRLDGELGRHLFVVGGDLWIGAPGSSAAASLANGAIYRVP